MTPPPVERTVDEIRGNLITQMKNGISFIKILIFEKRSKDIASKLEKLKELHTKLCNFCEENEESLKNYDLEEINCLFLSCLREVDQYQNPVDQCQNPEEVSFTRTDNFSPAFLKPSIFSGSDADHFLQWKESVEVHIKRFVSFEEKILALFSLTEGEARSTIDGFEFFPKNQATLKLILTSLQDRFGSEAIVVNQFFEQFDKFGPVANHDGRQLRKIANHIKKGLSMLSRFPSLEAVNSVIFQKKIISLLPKSLQETWVEIVVANKPTNPATTQKLLQIIEEKVAIIEHPLCSSNSKLCLAVANQVCTGTELRRDSHPSDCHALANLHLPPPPPPFHQFPPRH